MTDLILHQYEISPFSEKARVALGIKGLAWRACDQPVINPKPEMVRLTGGYRRIPVLQLGADIWFDSLYITEELDRLYPDTPSAFAGSGVGVARAFSKWTDGELFMGAVGLLFGGDWNADQAFLDDRSALIGQPFDPAQFAAAAPALAFQFRQQLDLIDTQLADGRAFLTGDRPDALDAAVRAQTAFVRWGQGTTGAVIDAYPRIVAWEARLTALGHGQRGPDISREDAITAARDATPLPVPATGGDGTFAPGDAVSVKYHDANSPVLEGTLLRIDLNSLTLKPTSPGLAHLHIHMPRSVGALSKQ